MSQPITTAELDSWNLWAGLGKAKYFRVSFTEEFQALLKKSMAEATQIYQERRATKTRKGLLKIIESCGLGDQSQARIDDRDDVIGIIGEIIVQHFVETRKLEVLWPKWRVGGTSKSPGVDLVTRVRRSSDWDLRLLESKHLHEETRSQPHEACCASIKDKLKDGLEEFDEFKTRINLTGILIQMSVTIRRGKAGQSNMDRIEQSHDFISSKLAQNDYSSEIVAALDSKYCISSTLSRSTKDLQLPSTVGTHTVNITVMACDSLEKVTDEIL